LPLSVTLVVGVADSVLLSTGDERENGPQWGG
jgi:hypothetical protein